MAKSSDNRTTPELPEEDSTDLYDGFVLWTDRKRPKWHPIKKMRYVFWRMIDGRTVTEALKEIHWSPSEFWHLIELKRNDPFRVEYMRAKKLQGRAWGDDVVMISEGRDRLTKQNLAKLKKMILRTMKRVGKSKTKFAVRAEIERLLSQIDANDNKILQRNKLQIESKKWLAAKVNPNEFSEKTGVALTGAPSAETGEATPLIVQFIAADGSVVSPEMLT